MGFSVESVMGLPSNRCLTGIRISGVDVRPSVLLNAPNHANISVASIQNGTRRRFKAVAGRLPIPLPRTESSRLCGAPTSRIRIVYLEKTAASSRKAPDGVCRNQIGKTTHSRDCLRTLQSGRGNFWPEPPPLGQRYNAAAHLYPVVHCWVRNSRSTTSRERPTLFVDDA